MKHLVFLNTSFLGDLVNQSASFQLVREEFPDTKIILITTQIGAQLYAGESCVDEVVVFAKRAKGLKATLAALWNVSSRLKKIGVKRKSTVFVQAHLSIRSSLLRIFLRLKSVVYEEAKLSGIRTTKVHRVAVFHESQRLALLLEPLGLTRSELLAVKPQLDSSEASEQIKSKSYYQKIVSNKVVIIAPGSVWGTKKWPLRSYSQLVHKLSQLEKDILIVLIGSNAEKADCDVIVNENTSVKNILNLAAATSIAELKWIISQAKMIVCNDSSPIHFASAYQIPTVAIFGPTIPEMGFAPRADKSEVVELEGLDCRPCSLHGPQVCPLGHFKCMRHLSVERVFNAVSSRL